MSSTLEEKSIVASSHQDLLVSLFILNWGNIRAESYQLYSADWLNTLIVSILVYTKPCLHVDTPYLHSSDTRDEEKSIFFFSRWRNVSTVFSLVECQAALSLTGSKGLTSSCRDYTSQNKNVDAGGQDLDGERSHPAVCRFHKHFHAHHTSWSYARGQHPSRLNQMLNTNPRMRANQEQFSFLFR